jgi:hypothetical protein
MLEDEKPMTEESYAKFVGIPLSMNMLTDHFLIRNMQAHTSILMNIAIRSARRRGFLSNEEQAVVQGNSPKVQQQRQKPLPLSLSGVHDGTCHTQDSAEVSVSNVGGTGSISTRKCSDNEAEKPLLKTLEAVDSASGASLEKAHNSRAANEAKPRNLETQGRRINVHGLKLDLSN